MKKSVLGFMLIAMSAFVLGGVSANAQSNYGVKANVPFDFIVGEKTFQAGTITARRMSTFENMLVISSADDRQHEIRPTLNLESRQNSDNTKLVFRKYGNRYYLAQVWTGYEGREFSKSPSERALQRELRYVANNAPAAELVTIIAVVQ
jgi:uncharacterized GH25 family protein